MRKSNQREISQGTNSHREDPGADVDDLCVKPATWLVITPMLPRSCMAESLSSDTRPIAKCRGYAVHRPQQFWSKLETYRLATE